MSSNTWLRLRRGSGLLACAAVLAACQDAEITAVNPTPAPTASLTDPLAQKVANMGFRTDMIVDEGEHFRVEGDIIIAKSELLRPGFSVAQPSRGAPVFQWHTNNLVAQSKMAQGLRVDLSGIAGNAGWLAAARAAISNWNWTYGTKIMLIEGGGSDITFSFVWLPSGTLAQASFPASGNPGGVVQISTSYNSLAASRKQWVLVHEIGHTLGYRHSNWDDLNEENIPEHYTVGANFIPNTLYTDPNSVMTGGVGSRTWSGFSSYDHTGNQYLYPAPAPTITSEGYTASNHTTFSWTPVADASAYRIYQLNNYWTFIYFDPQAGGAGYWGYETYRSDAGLVYGTTFDSGYPYYSTDHNSCYNTYEVVPVYPSGKEGSAVGTTSFNC